MTLVDPYPNGQGEGLDPQGPPVLAFVEIDMAERFSAGAIGWPPYEHAEAPPCGASGRAPAEVCIDGRERMFWCDKPAHDDDEHRCVTDLGMGEAMTWTGDRR